MKFENEYRPMNLDLKAPNSKLQAPEKFQNSSSKKGARLKL
jgi:hypothetical protein